MNYIISFLIAIFQILGLTTEARGESIDTLKYAYWRDHTPNVVICDGLKIEKENLEKAIEGWRQRGEKIGRVISKSCNERPDFGEIAFYYNPDIVGWAHHGKAQTSRYKGTDRLAYARIWLGNYNPPFLKK